ncbi:MAG: T9SS type A sorting domain-containing protein [Bacteroidetes bacterium]|nr:T9SS type A sorting domain-containing protein [Bacteroidota bacterium]
MGGPAMGVADFNGKLDEVRIWDRMLCPSEIAHYSNCEVSFPTNGLRSVFHFNQGVDGANNAGINTLVAENSSVVGALLNFGLNGITSNWDDAGVIATGSACPTYTANCAATSLNFDGINDYADFAFNPLHVINTGTIEAWIKTNDASTNFRAIVSKINAYGMFLRNNRLGVYNWATSSEVVVGNPINDNQWHHVAFVFKSGVGNGSQLYVDGVATGSPFTYTVFNHDNQLTIGNNTLASNQFFKGNIDEVRIWNRDLCPVEILANKDCNIPSGTSGLISVYHFDQGFDAANNATELSLINGSGSGSSDGFLYGFSLNTSVSNWVAESPVSSTSCNSFYTGVIQNGANLESVVSGGGITYQWYDCGTGNSIAGETNMAYTPAVNGTYKVLVTVNGCEVMSDCINYSSVGLKNVKNMKNELLVYPNPAKDKLNVKAEGKSLKVFNSLGVVVLTASLTKNETELQLTNLNSGVYYIVTDFGATVKFIKQ